jgi:hypothetical protein
MLSVYESVVSAHRRTLDRLIDRGAAERMRNVYDKATAEVLKKLERLGKGSTTFTAHNLRQALAQLRAGQLYINDQLLGELSSASRDAQVESLRGLVRDYKRLEKHFSGTAPVLPIEEAARFAGVIDKGRSSLLRQHETSIRRYGSQTIASTQDAMALSMAAGESLHSTIRRVQDVMGGEFWQAERVGRTECAYAANLAASGGIRELSQEVDDLYQRWNEVCGPMGEPLDPRTAVDSIAMHGQVVKPGGLFVMPATAPFPDAKGEVQVGKSLVGQSWQCPPNRPNDRATIEPWRPKWGVPGWEYRAGRRHWVTK